MFMISFLSTTRRIVQFQDTILQLHGGFFNSSGLELTSFHAACQIKTAIAWLKLNNTWLK